jgi:hypothetical protein
MVVAGAGVVDGGPDGGPLGDLDGDGVADGADHVSSWRLHFTEADVSSGVLSLARGGRVGSG